MKNTGIVRNVDELGRVVLPKELRRTLNIGEKDPVEIYVDGSKIILQKYVSTCQCGKCGAEAGGERRVVSIKGITLCSHCIAEFMDEI